MTAYGISQRAGAAARGFVMALGLIACRRPAADASPDTLQTLPNGAQARSASPAVAKVSPPRRDPWAIATKQTTRSRDRISFTSAAGLPYHWGADATHLYFSEETGDVVLRRPLREGGPDATETWLSGSTFLALEGHDVVVDGDTPPARGKRNKVSKQLVPFPHDLAACDRWAEGPSHVLCVHDASLGAQKPGSIVLYDRKTTTAKVVDAVANEQRVDDVLWQDGRFYLAESGQGLREVDPTGAVRRVAPLGYGLWRLKAFLGAIAVVDRMHPTTTVSFYSPPTGQLTSRSVNRPGMEDIEDIAADGTTLYVLGKRALVAWHASGEEECLELTHHTPTEAASDPGLVVTPAYVLWQRSPTPAAGAHLREFNLVGVRR